MKKQLTAEQIAKRDERRAKFKALWKTVAEMPEPDRVAMANKAGIRTCEGHALSARNQCLIALQCPAASIVGGFRQWIKQGRAVMKGQHGAMIWVPTGGRTAAPADGSTEPTTAGDEVRFCIGTVFDIGQTVEITADQAREEVAA